MTNETAWSGTFVIETKNKITGEVTREVIKNRIMSAVLDALANTLLGTTTDLEIKQLALGTGATAITDTDTKLANEIFRTAPTVNPNLTGTGTIETEFIILDNEAVATIEEIGIFIGSAATATKDTGTLLSRILWHKVKTSAEEITIKRIDKIQRG